MRRRFKPAHTRPEDFDAFWDSTRLQLEQIDPAVERVLCAVDRGIRHETVSFLSLRLEDAGPDRVRVCDAKGSPPPNTYKVSATYRDGYWAPTAGVSAS